MKATSDTFSSALLCEAAQHRITTLDLGARVGVDTDVVALAPAVVAIGFEPDPDEAKRLQGADKDPWLDLKRLPHAIEGKVGPATLHIPDDSEGPSLLPHD